MVTVVLIADLAMLLQLRKYLMKNKGEDKGSAAWE